MSDTPKKKRQRPSPTNGCWPDELAARWGVSGAYVRRLIREGKVRVVALGPRTRIIPDDELKRVEGRSAELLGSSAFCNPAADAEQIHPPA